jgi:hypothetical protein
MGRLSVVAALTAATLAACAGSQPVVLDASPAPDAPTSTGSIVTAPAPIAPNPVSQATATSQQACSPEVAAEFVRQQHTLQASNDPCVVYWRSKHPERSSYLECDGLKAYPDPQPTGHPISLADCDRKLRERQARMGVPVTGMTDAEKGGLPGHMGQLRLT